MQVTLTPATMDDFDFIYRIYNDETVNPYFSYPAVHSAEAFEKIFIELLTRDHFWIIADEDGHKCGTISIAYETGRKSHVAKIVTFAICSEYRGRGIGQAAIDQVLDVLTGKGVELIVIYAEEDNVPALTLYEKMGFKQIGRIPCYFKREDEYIDEIILALDIRDPDAQRMIA